MAFEEQAVGIAARAAAAMERVGDEMSVRSRSVTSVEQAKEILAETKSRMAAIIKVAADEIDRLALAEKRKEWS